MKTKQFLILLICILLFSCSKEKVKKAYIPSNAHEAYKHNIKQANLEKTALGKKWIEASENALNEPILITTPNKERIYFDESNPQAYGFKFKALRGQKVKIDIELQSRDTAQVFIDVFRVRESKSYYKIASLPKDSSQLEFIARRESEYILRIQPELLQTVLCTYTITKDAAFLFPVLGKNKSDIHSFFGAPRDGGKREHHGVDIFAARNTPVISPERAYVSSVGKGKRGGNYVWLYYPKISANLYFAHLETQDVQANKWITPGTQIGTVGNTGNARYTPPHLHFGIYMSGYGPIDPYHFIAKTNEVINYNLDDSTNTGKWLIANKVTLGDIATSDTIDVLIKKNTALFCLSENKDKKLVALPSGHSAYVKEKDLSPINNLNKVASNEFKNLFDKPDITAFQIEELQSDSLYLLAEYNNYYFVKTIEGRLGWTRAYREISNFHSVR